METATTTLAPAVRTYCVRKARLLVDRDVVHAADQVIVRVMLESERLAVVLPQSRQVKDLQAVFGGVVGDDEYVILVHLHVPPART